MQNSFFRRRVLCLLLVLFAPLAVFGCTNKCQHSGTPSADCSVCTCPLGWKGTVCQTWVGAPLKQLLHEIDQLAKSSKLQVDTLYTANTSPVGLGYDAGRHVLRLPVADATHATHTAASAQAWTGTVYNDMTHYTSELSRLASNGKAKAGQLASDGHDLLSLYRRSFVGRSIYGIYERSIGTSTGHLPFNGATPNFEPEVHLAMTLARLPLDISNAANKQLYHKVFDYWGTSFLAKNVVLGCHVSLDRSAKHCLRNWYSAAALNDQMTKTLKKMAKLPGGNPDSTFQAHSMNTKFSFTGGDPAKASLAHLAEWQSTCKNNPVPISWEYIGMDKIIAATKNTLHFPDRVKLASNLHTMVQIYDKESRAVVTKKVNEVLQAEKSNFLGDLHITGGASVSKTFGTSMKTMSVPLLSQNMKARQTAQMSSVSQFMVDTPKHKGCFTLNSVVRAACHRDANGALSAIMEPGTGVINTTLKHRKRKHHRPFSGHKTWYTCEATKFPSATLHFAGAKQKASPAVTSGCTSLNENVAVRSNDGLVNSVHVHITCCFDKKAVRKGNNVVFSNMCY
eukprot:TRINITY_DN4072_c0_g1_i3.p1 TRINITY_DN4072_c0_g1~~TRINITY_DN4072_c0_g1_i3.p1  ORF type:complete len:566 (+),score=83.87 TRINITY_DN4072_c0_g1_i3:121-1818(+)